MNCSPGPVSPTNKAIPSNPLHCFSPSCDPEMLGNISEKKVRTSMLEVFMKSDDDLFSKWMAFGKERCMQLHTVVLRVQHVLKAATRH